VQRTRAVVTLGAALIAASPISPSAQARRPAIDVDATIARVGERVIEWYDRAQSIVSEEDVRITPLGPDMSPSAPPRSLRYELRVAWDSDAAGSGTLPEPTILRQLLRVNGRAPRARDEPGCMDPKPVSPEPLMMWLPKERASFAFTFAGTARVDRRDALMIDYKAVAAGTPEVVWTKDCVSVDLPGRTRGRAWIDAATHDVLRLDEHLIGQFEFDVPREHRRLGVAPSMLVERADSSIRYRRVEFENPPDSLMLPFAVETVTVFRGSGSGRTRISQRFSGYRRFLADARVLP
jgi:hypothetical protein